MARPLRIQVADGWYHVTARGIDRKAVFRDDADRSHFLELLEDMMGRYRVCLHAYVLMDNHYHLLIQTPQANGSAAMQWLNVSYSVWFNRRHRRGGPLFQGRFKSIPVEAEGAWALQASLYLHLNPVRVRRLALGKEQRRAEGRGVVAPGGQSKGVSPGIRVNASLPAGCREAHKESFRRNSLVGFSGYFNRAALRRHFYKGRLGPWEYRRSVSFPGIGGDVFPDVWR